MRFFIKTFVKEWDPSLNRNIFVAIVEDSMDMDYPFRIAVENFQDPIEAKREILRWIEQKEAELLRAEEGEQNGAVDDVALESLNASL